MKKKIALLLSLVLLISCFCAIGASAAEAMNGPTVRVNGKIVTFPDGQPYYDENGRTMIPVRFVSEELGAKVSWDTARQTAVIEKGDIRVDVPIGKSELTVTEAGTSRTVKMDTVAVLKSARTYVPVRFVAEALGAYVEFSEIYQTVGIYSEVLTSDQIAALRTMGYTQPANAVGIDSAKKVYDADTLAFYYGTNRNSFSNFANAREHLYHTVSRKGTYGFPNLGLKLKDSDTDSFYRKVVEEAVSEIAYKSNHLKVEFLTDTSCIYQADNMDGVTCAVRGFAVVTLSGKISDLKGSEIALLCKLGFTKLVSDSVMSNPIDVHMNTQSGYQVNIHTIVPLGNAG